MNPVAENIKSVFNISKALSHEGVSILDGAPGRG